MKCILCNKTIDTVRGHNAEPLAYGRCCTKCNISKVIPARLNNASRSYSQQDLDVTLSVLNEIKHDGSAPAEMSAHASYLLEWLKNEVTR